MKFPREYEVAFQRDEKLHLLPHVPYAGILQRAARPTQSPIPPRLEAKTHQVQLTLHGRG